MQVMHKEGQPLTWCIQQRGPNSTTFDIVRKLGTTNCTVSGQDALAQAKLIALYTFRR
jgi:hypothetical protein